MTRLEMMLANQPSFSLLLSVNVSNNYNGDCDCFRDIILIAYINLYEKCDFHDFLYCCSLMDVEYVYQGWNQCLLLGGSMIRQI